MNQEAKDSINKRQEFDKKPGNSPIELLTWQEAKTFTLELAVKMTEIDIKHMDGMVESVKKMSREELLQGNYEGAIDYLKTMVKFGAITDPENIEEGYFNTPRIYVEDCLK